MLTIESGQLKLKASDLMIRAFLDAYAQDETEEKHEAFKLFWYIHIVSQIDSEAPFFRAAHYEIQELCKWEVYRDKNYSWKDSVYNELQVKELIQEYKRAYATPADRILQEYDRKVDEYQAMLKANKPTVKENIEKSGKVTFTTNQKIISDALIGVEKIMEARDSLVAKMKKEGEKGQVRGQQKPSLLEQQHEELNA